MNGNIWGADRVDSETGSWNRGSWGCNNCSCCHNWYMVSSGGKLGYAQLWNCIGNKLEAGNVDLLQMGMYLCSPWWRSFCMKLLLSAGHKLERTRAIITCSCSSSPLDSVEGVEDVPRWATAWAARNCYIFRQIFIYEQVGNGTCIFIGEIRNCAVGSTKKRPLKKYHIQWRKETYISSGTTKRPWLHSFELVSWSLPILL